MAFIPLNVAPLWRPWRQAGVTHLLLEPAALEALSRREAADQETPPPAHPSRPPSGQASVSTRPLPSPGAPASALPAQQAPTGAPCAKSASRKASSPRMELPDPETWPAAWKELLTRCGSARPRIVWTYTGLADDLGGRADVQRRNFFARLFRDLAMPKGSHAFWPLWPPASTGETIDVRFFFSGVRALNPDSVVLMCDGAPPSLELPRIRPFQPVIHQGRRYVLVRDPADFVLAPDEPAETATPRYTRMVSFLKSLHGRN